MKEKIKITKEEWYKLCQTHVNPIPDDYEIIG